MGERIVTEQASQAHRTNHRGERSGCGGGGRVRDEDRGCSIVTVGNVIQWVVSGWVWREAITPQRRRFLKFASDDVGTVDHWRAPKLRFRLHQFNAAPKRDPLGS